MSFGNIKEGSPRQVPQCSYGLVSIYEITT